MQLLVCVTHLCAVLHLSGIIEQRTSEILQAYAAAQSGQPNGESHSFQLPSPTILSLTAFGGGDNIGTNTNASTMSRLTVQPPSYEEMSSGGENSEGEEDERPLTRLELEKITLKDFMRKKQ
jgi:hypothetical protein